MRLGAVRHPCDASGDAEPQHDRLVPYAPARVVAVIINRENFSHRMRVLAVMSVLAIWPALSGMEPSSMAASEPLFRNVEAPARGLPSKEPPRFAFRTTASPGEPTIAPTCTESAPGWCPQALWLAAAFLVQTLMVFWLLHQRRRLNRSEARTRDLLARLVRGNQVAAAGEVSASISHELTQPITGMLSSANAALRWMSAASPDLEKARAALVQVANAGERASQTISGVRSTFRNRPPDQKWIAINDVVLSVLELVERELAARACTVEFSLDKSCDGGAGRNTELQERPA